MAGAALGDIVFSADDPARLAAFWSQVLGYPPPDPDGEFRAMLRASGPTDESAPRGSGEMERLAAAGPSRHGVSSRNSGSAEELRIRTASRYPEDLPDRADI